MAVARQRYVVVHIEPEAVGKRARRILFAFVGKLLRQFAQICLVDSLERTSPQRRYFRCGTLGYDVDVCFCCSVQVAVISQGVAIHNACGHSLVGHNAVVSPTVEHIVEAATGRKAGVAVQTDIIDSPVEHSVVNDKHFGEVVVALIEPKQFGFEEAQSRVCPAGRRTILVLDRRDFIFLNGGKDEPCGVFLRKASDIGDNENE